MMWQSSQISALRYHASLPEMTPLQSVVRQCLWYGDMHQCLCHLPRQQRLMTTSECTLSRHVTLSCDRGRLCGVT